MEVEKYVEMNAAHPFREGIDHRYYYEGYAVYKMEELQNVR